MQNFILLYFHTICIYADVLQGKMYNMLKVNLNVVSLRKTKGIPYSSFGTVTVYQGLSLITIINRVKQYLNLFNYIQGRSNKLCDLKVNYGWNLPPFCLYCIPRIVLHGSENLCRLMDLVIIIIIFAYCVSFVFFYALIV